MPFGMIQEKKSDFQSMCEMSILHAVKADRFSPGCRSEGKRIHRGEHRRQAWNRKIGRLACAVVFGRADPGRPRNVKRYCSGHDGLCFSEID